MAGVLRHHRQSRPKHQNSGAVGAGHRRRRRKTRSWSPSRATAAFSSRPMGTPCCSFPAERAGSRSGSPTSMRPPARRATRRKLTSIATEPITRSGLPTGSPSSLPRSCIPIARPSQTADFATGNQCNADRDKALADSKVKAQIFTHLLYRHWNHFTGDKRSHLFLVSVDDGEMRDLTPAPRQRCAAVLARRQRLRLRLFARLEGTGLYL